MSITLMVLLALTVPGQAETSLVVAPPLTSPGKPKEAASDAPNALPTGSTPIGSTSVATDNFLSSDPFRGHGSCEDVSQRVAKLEKGLLTLERVYDAFPELKKKAVFVSSAYGKIDLKVNGKQTIEEKRVYFGATLIKAKLPDIRKIERDYQKYLRSFGDKFLAVYPVSYSQGKDSTLGTFVKTEVYYEGKGTCAKAQLQTIVDYAKDGRPITDYYTLSPGFVTLKGRDLFFEVRDKGAFLGYLVLTAYTHDVADCADPWSYVQSTIEENLGFMNQHKESR